MGYGAQFALYCMPEWSAFYLDYIGLKNGLKTYAVVNRGATMQEEPKRGQLVSGMSMALEPLLSLEAQHDSWIEFFSAEVEKVGSFFRIHREDLEKEVSNIIDHLQSQKTSTLILSNSTSLRQQIPSLWRAVEQTHRSIWSLEVFCDMNYHACLHIAEKLRLKSGMAHIAARVVELSTMAGLSSSMELRSYRKRLYRVVSDNITKDINKARDLIASSERVYDPNEVFHIAFCLGASLIMVIWSFLLLLKLDHSVTVSSVPVFRTTFCFVFCLWICALVIYVFESYTINWQFVLEIKSQFQISYMRIMKAASWQTMIWSMLFVMHSYYLSFGYQDEHRDFISVGTWAIFVIFSLLPGYPDIRNGIGWTLVHIFITPFGRLEFRHFFLADILTSMTKPLTDVVRGFCYLASDSWIVNTPPECPHQVFWFCLITILPLYFRLLQCLLKYHWTRNAFPHLFNAAKYFFSISVVVALYIPILAEASSNHALWLSLSIFTTLFTICWDWVVDFGFLTWSNGLKIRNYGVFPRWFYILSAVLDALLRCVWIVTLYPMDFLGHDLMEVELVLVAVSVLELMRRGLWAVLRVENEKYSNIEKFRKVGFIPRVPTVVLD